MDQHRLYNDSRLFIIRVWVEELGKGRQEYRGKLQDVVSGEAHYFRDWAALIALLTATGGNMPGSAGLDPPCAPSGHE